MLIQVWHWLGGTGGDKITTRAGLAALVSFVLAILLGSRVIAWLRSHFREPIKSPSEHVQKLHAGKQWTPTMGGLFIVAGLLMSVAMLGDWSNAYLPAVLVAIVGLTAIGAVDDLVKLKTAKRGISARTKLIGQTIVATIATLLVYQVHAAQHEALALWVPGIGPVESLSWLFVPLAVLVIVASSNAVNLADGLDGLAGGCWVSAAAAMSLMVYAAGHHEWAGYLQLAYLPQAGEMLIISAAALGAMLGFLWFNCHPAAVFMGDTGSLPLGGLLGLLAVVARQEILLIVVGGVFVVEVASVIAQVAYFRRTGKRLLRCAPLHHHFQLLGWPESKIVVRFWIAAALCALIGLAGLKMGGVAVKDSSMAASEFASTDAATSGRWK